MSIRGILLSALAFAAPVACASQDSLAAGHAYFAGRANDAETQLNARLESDPDGQALYLNELGTIALARGDLDGAYRRFFDALQIMGSMEGANAKEVGAIVGSEASKIWKGDPYEKAMNSFYIGIIELLRNGNGLPGFKNAIFNDTSNGDEKYECDFAPAYFFEGISYERLGDATMAERSFAKARELAPECAALRADHAGNVIVVVDVGRGPTKVNAGEHGEATRFVAHPERPSSVAIVADGSSLGEAERAGDVYFQATTRGGRAFDAILKGKAIYKSAARDAGLAAIIFSDDVPRKEQAGLLIAGAALIASSFAVNAKADTRHWTTLPAEVQLFRGQLPPGVHQIEVVPNGGGRVAGAARQAVNVPATGNVLVYQRILP